VELMRVELKYSVPEDLAAWALKWSGVFLQRDGGLAGAQRITSLYLDTPTLTFFRWHCEGRADRFKLRVRGYGDATRDRVWAEIKRKTGMIVHKQRAPLPVLGLDSFLRDAAPEGAPSGDLQEFLNRRKAFHASPKLLLTCERDALRDKDGACGELAVTVDRRIQYQPTRRHDLVDDPNSWRAVKLPRKGDPANPAVAIVEVKYMHQPPSWMASLILRLAPHRVGFSKYRAATQQYNRRIGSD
jgi:hypothetical protein